jgi:potassium uptake TrkH family protein
MLIRVVMVIGFEQHSLADLSYLNYFRWLFSAVALIYLIRSFICIGFKSFRFDFFLFFAVGLLLLSFAFNLHRIIPWLFNPYFYSLLCLALFVFEFSRFDLQKVTMVLNPAQMFMASFALLIIAGASFLKLPNATVSPISFVDALFTATSAICVTGLTVVDTATQFTTLGKSIILILIQIGGIGIMTFTSFFGFFFKGGSTSFSERLALSDFFSEDNISQIRKTLAKVIFITLLFETIGATCLFFSLDALYFPEIGQRIRFSVFHSISAFCNAGFSTLTDNLYDFRIRGTYPILYVISLLIIFGGIGFPILLNFYTFIKFRILDLVSILKGGHRKDVIPMMINVNSRLVIFTTISLLVVGTVFFLIFEQNRTLQGLDWQGKLAHAFLGSTTPRTAGFNSVNMGQLSVATVVLTIFLMWVGASPISTGGGIKTSTFAIAILNALRIARMKNHIEFHKREVHERSVDRAFAIIILSIIILGCASLCLYIIEPDKGALNILFECVSAFGTVGLSMGITPFLNDISKLLLVMLMFMGRMGILTLLFAIFRKTRTSVYRYPKENIVIN